MALAAIERQFVSSMLEYICFGVSDVCLFWEEFLEAMVVG